VTEPSPPNEPDSRELALLVRTMFGVALLVRLTMLFFVLRSAD
jgi:hypothetical protein